MATCKVRIYLPLTKTLTPDTKKTGHYEIQIIGPISFRVPTYNNTLVIKTLSYTNPIISYGSEGISIYDNGGCSCPKNKMLCTLSINVSSFKSFKSWIKRYCEYDGSSSSSTKDILKVTSGDYKKYSTQKRNCFGAVSEWCNCMNYATLKSIYESSTFPNDKYDSSGYKKYIAWPMFKSYYKNWTFADIHT